MNQSAMHYGMIATGNHWYYKFAARSTTSVVTEGNACGAIPKIEAKIRNDLFF